MGLPVSRPSYSSTRGGEGLEEVADRLVEIKRRLHGQAADADVAGHHPLAADGLKDALQLFAFTEAVEEDGHRPDVERVGAEPDQVRVDASELLEQDAEPLGALRDLQLQELFDRQRIDQVIGHRRKVVDAVGERRHLGVKLRLAGLLDTGVEIADVGCERDNGLAIDLEHQTENAVGRGMLRAHVEDHRLVDDGIVAVVVLLGVGDHIFDARHEPVRAGEELLGRAHLGEGRAGLLLGAGVRIACLLILLGPGLIGLGSFGLLAFEIGDGAHR